MRFFETIANKWEALRIKLSPATEKIKSFFSKAAQITAKVWQYILRLKKLFLAIPVVAGAIYLALRNLGTLPAKVGLGLQTDGTFSFMLARELAVLGPVAVTALCLLLMFCSKRTLTPWFVSMFSLALPLLIWLINAYPC